jgi:Tfp pilus assembly protein FimT
MPHIGKPTRQSSSTQRCARTAEAGFSLLELVIVFSILTILIAMSLFTLRPQNRNAYASEDAALKVISMLREANGRALAQRQFMRVEIDPANTTFITGSTVPTIKIIDENLLASGDDDDVRTEALPTLTGVTMTAPTGTAAPPAPYNYTISNIKPSTGIWTIRFRSDGAAVDASNNPVSRTITFTPLKPGTTIPVATDTIRAVTVFGPSGQLKYWKNRSVSGSFKFVAEGR